VFQDVFDDEELAIDRETTAKDGDVPIVRLDSAKLRGLGWSNRRTSLEALADSIDSMIADARAGKFNGEPAPESIP
jgi:hypothetical protein